jgi:periplasmic protein TonB
MKTIEKAYIPAVHAENLEDIVFEGRNQTYGAYSLRRNYNSRVNLSMLAVISLASLIVLVAYIRTINKPVQPPVQQGGIIIVKGEPIDYEPPALPPPPLEKVTSQATIDATKYVPVIVDEVSPGTEQIAINEEMIFANNGPEKTPDQIIFAGNSAGETSGDPIENPDDTYYREQVSEQAMFRGGTVDDFRKWLAENIVYPQSALGGDIFGTVQLRFTIDKNGKVSDVQIDRGIHPLIDQAAADAVMSSPKWRAARINGNPVKVCYIIPIKFSILK